MWMEDFEAFQASLDNDPSHTSTLTRSLSLVLDEFYKNLRSVGVSAVSGVGMDAFFNAIEASAQEYMENYKKAEKERLEAECRKESMERLRKDMEKTKGQTVVLNTGLKDKEHTIDMMDEEDEEEEEEVEDLKFSEEDEEEDEGGK